MTDDVADSAPARIAPGTRFVEANGCTFEVLTHGTGDRLALCLHGFPEHAHAWRYQMGPLAELGYRVWAPNLRGYGRSSRPPRSRDYAIEELLADIDGLIRQSAASEVVLLAHDWGAVIAWYYAMHFPGRIDRLVILNVPHPACMTREIQTSWEQRRRSWYALAFQIPWLPERLLSAGGGRRVAELFATTATHPENFTAADLDIFRSNASTPGQVKAMIDYYRALVRGGGTRMARRGYPLIETPTLMLWGEEDMALTRATTVGTEAWVPNLTLRYLPGISHWSQQDAPRSVNSMISAWLGGAVVPHAAGSTAETGDRDAGPPLP